VAGIDDAGAFIDACDLVLLGEGRPQLVAAREERDVVDDVARLAEIDCVARARIDVGPAPSAARSHSHARAMLEQPREL
jgi:hypothetical protein